MTGSTTTVVDGAASPTFAVRLRRLVLGPDSAERGERPAFLGLLILSGVLYMVNLGVNGWANAFYSAAVQAGSSNWEAFFYGSSDSANSITVDKPPASLWLMDLSARLFGLSPYSILLPEALMGVATVGVVYATVRLSFSARTALLAGVVVACTPVAALMFRYNNPDALLTLLITLSVYFTVRGIQSGKLRWLLWAGVMVGLGFLTKQLQAFLILPALAGIYMVAAPGTWWRRVWQLLLALGAVIVSAGWWVAIIQLVPASMRPYVGGSQTNSFLELTFGYNGFGRLTGSETGSVTGGFRATTGGLWGSTGVLRMFQNEIGGQISWLLPAALGLALASLILMRGGRRDLRRATLILFTAWLLITGLTFSYAQGIFHAYYTVALAPAIGGMVAMGASVLWSYRAERWSRMIAFAIVFVTAVWDYVLLSEAPDWLPWLKWIVLVIGLAAAVLVFLPPRGQALTLATVAITLTAGLLAPAEWTIATMLAGHSGAIVTAGPPIADPFGLSTGAVGGPPGIAGRAPSGMRGGFGGVTGSRGLGLLLDGNGVGPAVKKLLRVDASHYKWVAAAVGSNDAANYQLATRDAVMPVGGFNGSDPSPTLSEFKADVAAGDIHYFIGGIIGPSLGGSDASILINTWVKAHFASTLVDGTTLYDLTKHPRIQIRQLLP